jgi:hypothetical protein
MAKKKRNPVAVRTMVRLRALAYPCSREVVRRSAPAWRVFSTWHDLHRASLARGTMKLRTCRPSALCLFSAVWPDRSASATSESGAAFLFPDGLPSGPKIRRSRTSPFPFTSAMKRSATFMSPAIMDSPMSRTMIAESPRVFLVCSSIRARYSSQMEVIPRMANPTERVVPMIARTLRASFCLNMTDAPYPDYVYLIVLIDGKERSFR